MPRATRDTYAHFQTMTSRWRDNDVFGHINNVVYLEYVDTCVNTWLLGPGSLNVLNGPIIGLVVESACTYHSGLTFPDSITAGLRVARIGNSSVRYEVGLFREDEMEAAAEASFTHVYVDRESRKPMALTEGFRVALKGLE